MNKISQTIMESLEIKNKECQARWSERGFNVVCGHPFPCPRHTDFEEEIKSHLLQSQIKLIEVMIEENLYITCPHDSRSECLENDCFIHERGGYNTSVRDQISYLTEVLNELKNV